MNHKITTAALLLGTLLSAGTAFADCPGPFVRDMKRAYENAKTAEGQGKKEDALFFYHGAQGSVCENNNPYEADAAKRAAPLGLELGAAAEKRGDFDKARQLYEAGGHFAAADRAFMRAIRPNALEPRAYASGKDHFHRRSETWFNQNNAAALRVTGAYKPDPELIAEVDAMPAKGIDHALRKEAASFNEDYLRDFVQLTQAQPDDPTDANALQRMLSAQQAFSQKWKNAAGSLDTSQEALQTLRSWSITVEDKKLAADVAAKVAQISEQHATALKQKYFGAPQLLQDAIDYYYLPASDNSTVEPKAAAVRALALKLGGEADAKDRYVLAASYYSVADADAKAEAVRERGRQVAMKKMQPQIDQMRKQADAIQKEYGDPAKVAEVQKQAEATRKAMQQQQQGAKANNRKGAEDLEKELGL
jgi:hypothetical protein